MRVAKTIVVACENCNKDFTIPRCRGWREKSCSSSCKAEVRARKKQESEALRTRACVACSTLFVARNSQIKETGAKYCSIKCSLKHAAEPARKTEKSRENQKRGLREAINSGRWVHLSGPDNPMWSGGAKAAIERQRLAQQEAIKSGESARKTREYRAKNPEKTREWAQKRKGAYMTRLPRGTVRRIALSQSWRCAICKRSVKESYHADHIMPIKLGGKHESSNIQILCPPCNVSKSAKHPVDYMQERGFLL